MIVQLFMFCKADVCTSCYKIGRIAYGKTRVSGKIAQNVVVLV